MTRPTRPLFVLLACCALCTACDAPPETGSLEIGDPLPGLTQAQRGSFLLGQALFTRVTSPDEGLGPIYNQVACSDCHGRPTVGGSGSTDRTLGKVRRWEDGSCDLLPEHGGDFIQKEATPALLATGYVPPEQTPTQASVRIDEPALAIFGMGLLEYIPEEDILSREDPDDADGDGISGRAGRDISGHAGQEGKLGLYTRKSEWNRMYDFIEGALNSELGLTSPRAPEEQLLNNGEPMPPEADPAPDPEIDEAGIDLLYTFLRFLAPPSPEVPADDEERERIAQGRQLFDDVGCADCHTPTLRTGESDIPAMAHQDLHLYSDLLLHDLGEENAGICGPHATPAEYRTALLWGLRYKDNFMHDGSATTLERSIELHGGESEASRDEFDALSAEDQALLLRFLNSL